MTVNCRGLFFLCQCVTIVIICSVIWKWTPEGEVPCYSCHDNWRIVLLKWGVYVQSPNSIQYRFYVQVLFYFLLLFHDKSRSPAFGTAHKHCRYSPVMVSVACLTILDQFFFFLLQGMVGTYFLLSVSCSQYFIFWILLTIFLCNFPLSYLFLSLDEVT